MLWSIKTWQLSPLDLAMSGCHNYLLDLLQPVLPSDRHNETLLFQMMQLLHQDSYSMRTSKDAIEQR
jgi:hypothetical protein